MLMASVVLAADFDMFMLRALAAAISPLGRKLCLYCSMGVESMEIMGF
jgi:hypothetical protein